MNKEEKILERGITKVDVSLEEIAKTYGMNDYYDMYSGLIFVLSMPIDNGDGTLNIPVFECGKLIGHVRMNKVN